MSELIKLVTSKELDDYLLRGERADELARWRDYLDGNYGRYDVGTFEFFKGVK